MMIWHNKRQVYGRRAFKDTDSIFSVIFEVSSFVDNPVSYNYF